MTTDDVKEVKSTIGTKKSNIAEYVGAYINSDGTVRTIFRQDAELMGDAAKKAASLLKKAIGCERDKGYATVEVDKDAEEYHVLDLLREQELKDDESLRSFAEHLAENYHCGEKERKDYILLMASNVYDVPADKDSDLEDQSSEVYRYIVGVVCPTKVGDFEVNFSLQQNKFKTFDTGSPIGAPAAGFLFPAFIERSTDTNSAQLFIKKAEDVQYDSFTRAVFGKVETVAESTASYEEYGAGYKEDREERAESLQRPTVAEPAFDDEDDMEPSSYEDATDAAAPFFAQAPMYPEPSAAGAEAEDLPEETVAPPEPSSSQKNEDIFGAEAEGITIYIPRGMGYAVVEKEIDGKVCLVIEKADVLKIRREEDSLVKNQDLIDFLNRGVGNA